MKCFNRKLFCRCCWLRLLIYWLVAEAENVAAISCSIECQVKIPKCCFKYTTTDSSSSSSSSRISRSRINSSSNRISSIGNSSSSISNSSKIENHNTQLTLVAENMPHWWCLHIMPTQEAWHIKKHRHVRHAKPTQFPVVVEMEPEETQIDDRLKPFSIFRPMKFENHKMESTKRPESNENEYYDEEEEYEDDDDDEEKEEEEENENEKNDENDDEDDDDLEEQNENEYEENDEDVDEAEASSKASKKKIRQRQRKKRRRIRQKYGGKRKKDKITQHVSLGQPANLLLASLTSLPTPIPIHHHNYVPTYKPNKKKPDKAPIKHIKYILHKGGILKKKKQEYLSHLGYVFLPLVKFVAFFTVLNPFTLAVFFFMLISPIVFGILGFTVLSLVLRPLMNLLFAVKHRVGDINRRKHRYQQRKRLPNRQRPITIHKHYYTQQQPQRPPYHRRPIPLRAQRIPLKYLGPHRRDMATFSEHEHSKVFDEQPQNFSYNFNPILPHVKYQLRHARQAVVVPTSETMWQPYI